MWMFSSIFSSIFSSDQFLEFTILLRKCDSVFRTVFSQSKWCWIFMQNWKQYCKALTRYKFSLFIKKLINIICFMIWIMMKWSVQIMMSAKDSFIIWWIFLIIQTKQIIFNFIDQYWVSASVRSLLRKRINLIFCWFFLMMWSSKLSWSFCI